MGSIHAQLKKITSNDGTTSNPDHTDWTSHNQLLFHAMFASHLEPVVPLIASAKTFPEAWNRLTKLYANG
ncbi:hypothetical protein ACOSQ2_021634 [Xanthoceras sorbifolium]